MTQEWRLRGQVPRIMKGIRQVALPKPGKEAVVPNLRPISVHSAWRRAYESSSIQTGSFATWRKNIGVPGVAYRESAEYMAAVVGTQFSEWGYMSALDYSRMYDHMDPVITARGLIKTGSDKI